MIKNVIFDIGRVMIEFDWEQYLAGLFDAETAKTVSDAMWGTPAWNELDRNVIPMHEVIDLFIANAPDYAAQIQEAMQKIGGCPRMMPYAIPWVEELKARGYLVFYLSNYFEYLMQERPDVLEFTKHMDGGVFSWQERITKPEPEIYQRLMQRYDLRPEECVFIDDSPQNIEAANALGIHAFLFESYEKQHPQIMQYLAEHTK
ncbi:MAG: HAD family phosphatase [Oscillospiraceae bacterium]|nr:HAD family phosphatase [Oscillospiraceae bacterium]